MAALQGVMAGGSVTKTVAAKWKGNGPVCPHCSWGVPEDDARKWWDCPCWDAAMHKVVPHADATRAAVAPSMLSNGVVSRPAALDARRSWLEAWECPAPPRRKLGLVCTDGSAVHTGDPAARAVAWAVC